MQTLIDLAHAIAAELSELDTVHRWTATPHARDKYIVTLNGGTDEIWIDGNEKRARFRPIVTADLARHYAREDDRPRPMSCFTSIGAAKIAEKIVSKVLPEYRQCKSVLMHRFHTERARRDARKETAATIAKAVKGTLRHDPDCSIIYADGISLSVSGGDNVRFEGFYCNAGVALRILKMLARE